ncbi:MAG TPA: site-specific integrase, partial [Dermatophilaceae bacterium]
MDHLRVERGAAANTLSSYRRDLERYRQFLDERGINDPAAVGESDVMDFLAALRDGAPERPA